MAFFRAKLTISLRTVSYLYLGSYLLGIYLAKFSLDLVFKLVADFRAKLTSSLRSLSCL